MSLPFKKVSEKRKGLQKECGGKSILYPGNNNKKEGNKNNTEASEIRQDPGECGGKESRE